MYNFLYFCLKLGFYVGLSVIFVHVLEDSIRNKFTEVSYKADIKRRVFSKKERDKQQDSSSLIKKVYYEIDARLYLVDENYDSEKSVQVFLVKALISAIIVAGVAVAILWFLSMGAGSGAFNQKTDFLGPRVWLGVFLSAFIIKISQSFLSLNSKYRKMSVRASFDLIEVVKLFAGFSSLKPELCIERVVSNLSDDNILKNPLSRLSKSVSRFENPNVLKEEMFKFHQAIGTTFSLNFITDFLHAVLFDSRTWQLSLLTLSSNMEKQEQVLLNISEASKDAISIGRWVNLFVSIGCYGGLAAIIGVRKFLDLQFGDGIAMLLFWTILVFTVLAFIIAQFLATPKLDYH